MVSASSGRTAAGDHASISRGGTTLGVSNFMTDAQTEIWIAAQVGTAANAFIESFILELEGSLDPSLFRQAVHEAVNRHDALRTAFGADGEDRVAPGVTVEVPVADLGDQPDPA